MGRLCLRKRTRVSGLGSLLLSAASFALVCNSPDANGQLPCRSFGSRALREQSGECNCFCDCSTGLSAALLHLPPAPPPRRIAVLLKQFIKNYKVRQPSPAAPLGRRDRREEEQEEMLQQLPRTTPWGTALGSHNGMSPCQRTPLAIMARAYAKPLKLAAGVCCTCIYIYIPSPFHLPHCLAALFRLNLQLSSGWSVGTCCCLSPFHLPL